MSATLLKNNRTEEIFDLLKYHGSHALAYHTLQPGLSHFVHEDGYLAYAPLKKTNLVLGDPVCEKSKVHMILDEFIRRRKNLSFIQISRTTASALLERGFKIFQIGVESNIKLPFSLHGREKADLRNSYNSASKNMITVKELNERSAAINDLPSSLKHRKEFSFLARHLEKYDEKYVRLFGGYQRGELKYISLFDPIYKKGDVESYAEVISRRYSDAPKGIRIYVLLEAMKTFYKEGRKSVNLGLSPLYRGCQPSDNGFQNRAMDFLFKTIFEHGYLLYNFKGLAFHKSRFKGEEQPVYFASRNKYPILPLIQTYLLTTGRTITLYAA